jgi:hypothetical protein
MLGVQPIARERNGDGWLLSILATADLSGRRRATPKLALGRTPVKAVRVRRAKRPAGGALDGSTRWQRQWLRHGVRQGSARSRQRDSVCAGGRDAQLREQ